MHYKWARFAPICFPFILVSPRVLSPEMGVQVWNQDTIFHSFDSISSIFHDDYMQSLVQGISSLLFKLLLE